MIIAKFGLAINFTKVIALLTNAFGQNQQVWLGFILLLGFLIFNCFGKVWPYYYQLKKRLIACKGYEGISFCFLNFLISAITPFAIGSESFVIYGLTRQNLSIKEANAIVATTMVFNPGIQVVISWPAFFILSTNYQSSKTSAAGLSAYGLTFSGLMVDLMGSLFGIVLSLWTRAHYGISCLTNWFLKLLKKPYKTKTQIYQKHVEAREFKTAFIKNLRDATYVTTLTIGALVQNFYYYGLLIVAFKLINPDLPISGFALFNYINVATSANNFSPIPGAEGSLQAILLIFINYDLTINQGDVALLKDEIDGAILIGRAFSFYLPVLLSINSLVINGITRGQARRRAKKLKLVSTKSIFTIVIFINHNTSCHLLVQSIQAIVNKNLHLQIRFYFVNQDLDLKPQLQKQINDYLTRNFSQQYLYQYIQGDVRLTQLEQLIKISSQIKGDYLIVISAGVMIDPLLFEKVALGQKQSQIVVCKARSGNKAYKRANWDQALKYCYALIRVDFIKALINGELNNIKVDLKQIILYEKSALQLAILIKQLLKCTNWHLIRGTMIID